MQKTRGHALVTGAFGGLGTAMVQRLLDDGTPVVACDRRIADAEIWSSTFTADHRRKLTVEGVDITQQPEVEALRARLDERGIHVAYLINNAGVAAGSPPWSLNPKTFDIVVRVNLYGTFYLTRAFCEPMVRREFGRIVNFASLYAYTPGPGQSPYAAAKGGIIGYTHSIARDLGPHGVTANVIAPGLIWHERLTGVLPEEEYESMRRSTPLGRAGVPAEIAGTVAFLLSDDAAYITGQTIHVNGGAYMPG